MNMPRIILVPAVALALSLGAEAVAFAESPAHASPASSNAIPTDDVVKAAAMPVQKIDVTKACWAAADRQNLHGKARKTFYSACRRHGGPSS